MLAAIDPKSVIPMQMGIQQERSDKYSLSVVINFYSDPKLFTDPKLQVPLTLNSKLFPLKKFYIFFLGYI